MIPSLAFIVSGYVVFRALEVFAFHPSRYTSSGNRTAMCVLAVLLIVAVVFLDMNIVVSGAGAMANLPTP